MLSALRVDALKLAYCLVNSSCRDERNATAQQALALVELAKEIRLGLDTDSAIMAAKGEE